MSREPSQPPSEGLPGAQPGQGEDPGENATLGNTPGIEEQSSQSPSKDSVLSSKPPPEVQPEEQPSQPANEFSWPEPKAERVEWRAIHFQPSFQPSDVPHDFADVYQQPSSEVRRSKGSLACGSDHKDRRMNLEDDQAKRSQRSKRADTRCG